MTLLKRYRANMIREAEAKAKYYEAMAGRSTNQQTARNYYRKARIQLAKIKGLL